MKWTVSVEEVKHGRVIVEAESYEEAIDKALTAILNNCQDSDYTLGGRELKSMGAWECNEDS